MRYYGEGDTPLKVIEAWLPAGAIHGNVGNMLATRKCDKSNGSAPC